MRQINKSEFDIHDRVNYAVTKREISFDGKEFTLSIEIDLNICSIMNYFEIFMKRMILCQRASEYLNIKLSEYTKFLKELDIPEIQGCYDWFETYLYSFESYGYHVSAFAPSSKYEHGQSTNYIYSLNTNNISAKDDEELQKMIDSDWMK